MDNFGNFECPKSLGGDLELIGNSREVSFPVLIFDNFLIIRVQAWV